MRTMRTILSVTALLALAGGTLLPAVVAARERGKVKVAVTCSSYRPIAEYVGGPHVEVIHLVEGYQDPHIVRPKPSLAVHLAEADLFVATGLDLEMWAPALVDQASNPRLGKAPNATHGSAAGLALSRKSAYPSRGSTIRMPGYSVISAYPSRNPASRSRHLLTACGFIL